MDLISKMSKSDGSARRHISCFALWVTLLLFSWSGFNSTAIGQCVAPQGISISNVTSSSASVSWNTVAGAINYEITYNQQGSSATTTQQTTGSSLFIPGLAPGTNYEVRVKSVCGGGQVSGNSQSNFTTQGTSCIAPSNLTATSSSSTSMTLNWVTAVGAVNYFVSYNIQGNPNVQTIPVSSPPFELTGLQANTNYTVSVRSNCGVSGLSAFATITANPNGSGGGGNGGNCTTPTNFRTTSVGATSVTLGWESVTGALNYEVSYKRSNESGFTTFNTTTNSSVLSGLTPNSVYQAKVRSACGNNSFSTEVTTSFTTPNQGVICNPPTNFRTTGTSSTTATLAWNGVGGANNYEITYRRVGESNYISVTTNNSTVSLTNLQSDANYEVRIRSFCGNDIFSSFVTTSFFTSENGGSGCTAPSGLTVNNITATSAQVSWTNVPGSTSYQIRFRVSGGGFSTGNSAVNNFPLTGLLPLTTYEVFVLSICSEGNSTESTTTFTTPSAVNCSDPSNFAVSSITGTTAQLSWNVVGAATSYEVQYRRTSDANFTGITAVSANTGLTGLLPNTNYEARVRSNCSNGSSSNFVSTTFVTGNDNSCSAPGGLQSSSVTPSSITIAFNVVPSALDYEVSYRVSGSSSNYTTFTSTTASTVISGLSSNTGYEIRVRSRCAGSTFSAYSSITASTSTGQGTCQTPGGLTTSNITATGFTVSWGSISGITNYEVQYRRVGDANYISQNVGTNSAIITGLALNSNYEVRVRSACSNGVFSDFSTLTVTTGGSACAMPTSLVINNISGTSSTAVWNAAPGISTYEVGIRKVGDANFMLFTAFNTSYNFSNLSLSTNYEVRVRSICVGNSVFSEPIAVTFTTTNGTSTNCFAPSGLVATAVTNFAASIAWNAVPGNNAYEVSYRPTNNGNFIAFAVTNNSTQITGLTPNTAYEVRVRTICPASTFSGYISTNFITTVNSSNCEPPSALAATNVNSGGVTVTWNYVPLAKDYEISYRLSSSTVYTTRNTISNVYFINDLLPGKLYEVRLRSNCGNGLYSNYAAVTFTTIVSTECTNPSNLVASNPTNTGITLSWSQIDFATKVEYEIGYRSIGSGIFVTQRTTNNTVILSGLIPNQDYEWRVRTICASNAQSNYSNSVFKTAPGIGFCSTPTNLFSSDLRQNGARLDWTLVKNAVSYQIKIRRVGDSQVNTYTTPLNMYSFSGLIPGSTYNVDVSSICADGFLSVPVTAVFTTVAEQGCNPPSEFKVSNIGMNSALLNWVGVSNASSYEITYRRHGDFQSTTFQVGGNTNSFLLNGLFRNTNYDVNIRTICQNNAVSIFTGMLFTTTDYVQCMTPTRFTAADITEQSVRLSWDPINGSNSFEVSIRKVGDAQFVGTIVTGTSKSYVNLLPNTEYEARIRTNCLNTVSFSNYSSIKFTTVASSNPCLAPELMLVSVTNTVATINWMAIQQNYEIQYRIYGANYVSKLESLTPPYILRDLTPNTTYEVRVRNFCDTRMSDYSKVLLFTTKVNSCTPPVIALKTKTANTISVNIANGNSVVEVSYKESSSAIFNRVLVANSGYYTLTGLMNNRSYDIQVRNFCGGVFSDYSNQLSVVATNLVPSCEVPVVDVASVTSRSAFIYWPTKMTFYEVSIRNVELNETKKSYESNVGSLLINNLTPNTPYEVSIRNICNGAFSESSTPIRFTTRTAKAEESVTKLLDLMVYPNPNNGQFNVKFNSDIEENFHITLTDVNGKTVFVMESKAIIGLNEIPVTTDNLAAGIYMLKLNNNGVITTQKVIIN